MSLASLLAIPLAKKFLQDGDAYAKLEETVARFDFPSERMTEFLDLTDAVLDDQIGVTDIPHFITEAFGVSPEKAQEVAVAVVGVRLLPLKDFVPGVEEAFLAWGGKAEEYTYALPQESITIEALTERIAQRAHVSFSELLMKRLAFLIEQRASNQKTDESLRTFFGRPLTIGGMGLPKEDIDALMQAITTTLPGVRIITQNEEGEAPPTQSPREETVRTEPQETFVQRKEEAPITALEIAPSHEVAAEVPVISSPEHQVRPRIAVPKVSGAHTLHSEVPDAQAKKKAEKAKSFYHQGAAQVIDEAIAQALEATQSLREEYHISSEEFGDSVKKMLKGIRDIYQTRDLFEQRYHVMGDARIVLTQALQAANAMYSAIPAPQPEERSMPAPAMPTQVTDERFAKLVEPVQPDAAHVALTVGSVAPVQNEQKKVTDVVAGNRLMGPIEQLETLTLADFRRLSTNPEEAVRKMEALLLALQKMSYEDRILGVLAWRKSPLAHLAVALTTESLNTGVTVAEIAARRRSQGQESLGPAEMQALSKWNEKVRF